MVVGSIIGAVAVLLLILIIAQYNKLVNLRNRVKNQWSQVDVVLKRRYDLIPNLVETVKGYATHERETLEAVIRARNTALSATTPADMMNADGELTRALSKIMALTESYPELKANANFTELQRTLNDTENKIAYARQFYNDTVMKYENQRQTFPTNIVAGMFGFKEIKYFEASQTERENVRVAF